jgi:hypothetical protein
MTTDLSTLTATADRWDGMAGEFAKRESQYRRDVHGVTLAPSWQGASADAAHTRFSVTLKEFRAAQTEARAVASLLRDAHAQFVELRGRVRAVRHDAVAAGLRVSESGVVSAVPDQDSAGKNGADKGGVDKDRPGDTVCVSASSWQQRLDRAVRDVGDADHGVGIALRAVAVDSDPGDGTLNGFNAHAKGDVEQYEAVAADVIARKLAAGGDLSARELAELRRLFRGNDHDTAFSRTFLDGLGADGTLRMTNRLGDLLHPPGGGGDPGGFSAVESGLARTLATATHDTHSPWYEKWRSDLHRAGVERYDTVFNGERLDKIRGYQSLVTLMRHGDGYSPQFLSDVGDGIMRAEKADPDIWDLKGDYSGSHGGWFANDPMDGLLGVMSHDPDAAASYLGSDARMKYLVEDRDWRVAMDASDNAKAPTYSSALDGDDRAGFGAALQAATTGIDPSDPHGEFVHHTKANDAVFRSALHHLAQREDGFPASLRDPMARILVNHGDTVHYAASSIDIGASPLAQDQLFEVVKQVSKDESAYGTLNHEMNRALVQDIHRTAQEYPEESLIRAGRTVGFLEEARSQTSSGPETASFKGKWMVDQAIGYVPVISGQVQTGFDYVTDEWLEDEQKRLDDKATAEKVASYSTRNRQLIALGDEWWKVHGSGGHTPANVWNSAEVSAEAGISRGRGISGEQ